MCVCLCEPYIISHYLAYLGRVVWRDVGVRNVCVMMYMIQLLFPDSPFPFVSTFISLYSLSSLRSPLLLVFRPRILITLLIIVCISCSYLYPTHTQHHNYVCLHHLRFYKLLNLFGSFPCYIAIFVVCIFFFFFTSIPTEENRDYDTVVVECCTVLEQHCR